MQGKPVNNMDVKRNNRILLLRCILGCEQATQPELAQKVSMSWPTVLQNVKELMELGLVKEVGALRSTGGRKPKAFAPVRDARAAIGVNITRNHISLVLVNLTGQILYSTFLHCPFQAGEAYFDGLGQAVADLLRCAEFPEERLLGVCIALPGIISVDERELVYSHVLNLHQFSTDRFGHGIPYRCRFVNDANAAGFSEIWDRQETGSLVYLSLSNSVGGAIVRNGRICRGNHQRAGEFGHNTLYPGGKKCYCGKEGCVDAYCSARVLMDEAGCELEDFFQRLETGDDALRSIWERYLDNLSIFVNNLRMSFDCDVVVGGSVGSFLEPHLPALKKRLQARSTFPDDASYVKSCKHRHESEAVGAALLLIEEFIEGV